MPAQPPPREPSMEEILASIRRIIAEDGPSPEVARPDAARPAAGRAAEARADEPLDLTEFLDDAPPEPLVLTDLDEPAAADAPAAAVETPSPPLAPPAAPALASSAPASPAPASSAPAEPPVATPEVVRRAAPAPVAVPPPEPQPRTRATLPPSPAVPVVPAPPPAAEPAAELVPPRAQEQAAAALGELARSIRQDKQQRAQPGARSPLETLVLEALKPSLKAWLDQNLGPLVERVVREEVRRLARRVEDQ